MQIDVEELLNLYLIDGIGSARLRALVTKFGSVSAIAKARLNDLVSIDGIDQMLAQRIKQAQNLAEARRQIKLIQDCQARLITFWDAEYPENLKKIYDPPVLLFIRGAITLSDKNAIALVGTRTPTAYGRGCVELFSRELVQQQITIVSGMARGIDTYAHWAAINAGGRTIAVLGSGVDVIYPPENKTLMPKMIEQGAIVSEFLMGAKPDAPNFPRRNRIVSGISLGVVVVEAGKKSGALITANIALEQNREVFAIPGNINSAHSIGTNLLIQEGAKLVTGAGDVIDELKPQLSHLLATAKIKRKQISLTTVEQTIWDNLSTEPLHIDQIASINQMSVAQALGVLLALELKEMVIQMPGKYFIKSI